MPFKRKFLKGIKIAVSCALVAVAAVSVVRRMPEVFSDRDTALAAAAFTLTDGKVFAVSGTEPSTAAPQTTAAVQPTAAAEQNVARRRDKTGYYDSFGNHAGEARYAVEEKTILPDGVQVDGCYVKNYTGLALHFEELLRQPLPFQTSRDAAAPQVLIYHTHTSEAYLDEDVDWFYESYYSRTANNDYNVAAVGEAIAGALRKNGIAALHDTTVHDATYDGSYERSAQTVTAVRERYPSVKVVLDIHRDALGSDERKVKTVFEHNGKKGAQIMILAGCDPDNERGFAHWKNNLNFALKLQHAAEEMYPGMTRPLDFGFFAYNEYLCDGSLLIEVGTDANTVEEAEYAGVCLANALNRVLA